MLVLVSTAAKSHEDGLAINYRVFIKKKSDGEYDRFLRVYLTNPMDRDIYVLAPSFQAKEQKLNKSSTIEDLWSDYVLSYEKYNRMNFSGGSSNDGLLLAPAGVRVFPFSYCSYKPIRYYEYIDEWFKKNKVDCHLTDFIFHNYFTPILLFVPAKKTAYLQYAIHNNTPKGTYAFFTKPYPKDNCLFQKLKKGNVKAYSYELYEGGIKDNPVKVRL